VKSQQRSDYVKKKLSAYTGSPKYLADSAEVADDTILCDMQMGKVRSGILHYSDEFILSCAQSLAYYLLDNPDVVKQMENDYGRN
jgi:hypothetical protein